MPIRTICRKITSQSERTNSILTMHPVYYLFQQSLLSTACTHTHTNTRSSDCDQCLAFFLLSLYVGGSIADRDRNYPAMCMCVAVLANMLLVSSCIANRKKRKSIKESANAGRFVSFFILLNVRDEKNIITMQLSKLLCYCSD